MTNKKFKQNGQKKDDRKTNKNKNKQNKKIRFEREMIPGWNLYWTVLISLMI